MNASSLKKDFLIILTYIVTSIVLEITLFLFLKFGVFPQYVLFDFGFLLLISGLLFILPGYKSKVAIALTFIIIQAILNCVNITLYHIFGDIFTFDMLTLGNEAAAAFSLSFIQWWSVLVTVAIVAAAVVAMVFILKSGSKKPNYNQKVSLFLVFTFICSFALGMGFVKLQKNYLENVSADYNNEYFESDDYLYENLNIKISALKKFGTYGLYMTDIYNSLGIQNAAQTQAEKEETMNYIENAKTISELGLTNDFTGISQGNNVITIMVESLEWFAIDEILTPNLYYLTQNSLNFQSFYARNKTNVSEGIGILGSYPKDTQFSTFYRENANFEGLYLPFSLPNMIKAQNENAQTSYFHNYYGYFYGRKSILPSFGFDNVTCLEDIDAYADDLPDNFNDFMLDSIMFLDCLNEIAPNNGEQFYSHITTLSMHGGYDFDRPRVAENLEAIEDNWVYLTNYINTSGVYTMPTDPEEQQMFKNYKAAAIETDKAIGILLDYLNETGLIENTTIIVYGDHNTYMSSLTNIMKGLEKTDLFTTELYRIPLLIYDQKALAQYKAQNNGSNVVNTFTTTFNIVPTVLDLLGIDYKPDLYQGKSVFSDNYETGFISILGGIFDNNFFSYDTIEILYRSPNATDEDLRKYQQNAVLYYEKQLHFERIYKYNLFAQLEWF